VDFLVSLSVLSFLIFFHELGHFLFARLFKVEVEVFSIGFGTVLLSKKVGATDYRLSAIPLGGYVKMKGQDDLDPKLRSSDDNSYNSKHPLQRIMILFGGPLFNFILAFLLFIAVANIGFQTLSPTIGEIIEDMAGYESGLRSGDKILEIDGEKITTWSDMADKIGDSSGALGFKLDRNGTTLLIPVLPQISESKNIFGETIEKRMVGVAPSGDTVQYRVDLTEAFIYGAEKTYDSALLIFKSVEKLIVGVLSLDQLGGVVSIFEFTAKASETGIVALFMLTALLSVNLGVLNLLPIPALDGGHIIFNLYELITRRVPSENIMYQLTLIGWAILLTLMGIGLYNDINRLISE
jgi:regulator of sigma E protease